MQRATIKVLKNKGYNNKQIAKTLGIDRKTIARVLDQDLDHSYQRSPMAKITDPYKPLIHDWILEKVPVKRMLELAKSLEDGPYKGGKTAFYEAARAVRQEIKHAEREAFVRFECLPAEHLQVDWGETKIDFAGKGPQKRYFLCCRLKYSRFMFVEFHDNMRFETLIRSLLRCFKTLGGVPWQLVFDNMKTVTIGRDDKNRPVLNERFKKFVAEIGFAPEFCAPRAGNQKGSVENLVKFVKSNFLPARSFHDEQDLKRELKQWLGRVNGEKSQAHGEIPRQLLEKERFHFEALVENAEDYGILELLKVNTESLVQFETNRYSVPVEYVGRVVLARVHESKIRLYDGDKLIGEHDRARGQGKRIRELAHYAEVLDKKPRAKVLFMREKLLEMGQAVHDLVVEISRRRKNRMGPEIRKLWSLKESHSRRKFVRAVKQAAQAGLFTSEYVEAFLANPKTKKSIPLIEREGDPEQNSLDRNLSDYDRFANGGQ